MSTRRSRRIANRYDIDLQGLDLRQQRRLLRRLVPVYTQTPWANPKHDVAADFARVRERATTTPIEEDR